MALVAHLDSRPARVFALLIAAYQRYLSPRKGFGCAVRVRRGRLPCSEFAKRAVIRRGVIGALPLVRRRFRLCAQTAKAKPTLGYESPKPRDEQPHARERSTWCDCSPDCYYCCEAGELIPDGLDGCDCTPW